MLAGYDWR